MTQEHVAFRWALQESSGWRAGHLSKHLRTASRLCTSGPGKILPTRTDNSESQLITAVRSLVSNGGDLVKSTVSLCLLKRWKDVKRGLTPFGGCLAAENF